MLLDRYVALNFYVLKHKQRLTVSFDHASCEKMRNVLIPNP